jgi:hypothetical protein
MAENEFINKHGKRAGKKGSEEDGEDGEDDDSEEEIDLSNMELPDFKEGLDVGSMPKHMIGGLTDLVNQLAPHP